MPDLDGKTESEKVDPGDLARVLELELLQKRKAWQRKSGKVRAARAAGALFLLLVLAAAACAFYMLFSQLEGHFQPQPARSAEHR